MAHGPARFLDLLAISPRVTSGVLSRYKRKKPRMALEKTRLNHNTIENHQCAKSPLYDSRYKYHRPYYLQFNGSDWNREVMLRQHLRPLSLLDLQKLVDSNRIDTNEPIDLATLCLTGLYHLQPQLMEGGFMLTDEGVDIFKAKINIEVQYCPEAAIAAIERNGGTVTAAYLDPYSISAMRNPEKFFQTGIPIPKRMLPPNRSLRIYATATNRGYLADPDEIAEERYLLSQKYGYNLPDLKKDEKYDMLIQKKDPVQIFYGLQPGWVVNLRDKVVVKPTDETLLTYYNS